MKKRIEYLDKLRLLAISSIILLHAISLFRFKYFPVSTMNYFWMTFLDSFTRFGVPVFFMLTGILMFQKEDEKTYFEFFRKRVFKLIIAYVFFSGIYYGYHIITNHAGFSVLELVREVTSSQTEYHLWFLPSMILIYFFIPFLKKFVIVLSKVELRRIIRLIFLLGNLFIGVNAVSAVFGYPILSDFTLPNLIGYTNYCFLGYYLDKYQFKVSKKMILLAILSILCMPIATVLVSRGEINDVFMNSLSIFVVYPTSLIFLWVKNHTKKNPAWVKVLSEKSFYVYLIHVLFLSLLERHFLERIANGSLKEDFGMIVFLWIGVAICSFLFAFIWMFLKEWFQKRREEISHFLVKLFLGIVFILLIGIILNFWINPYHFIQLNYGFTLFSGMVLIGIYVLLNKNQKKLFSHKGINRILLLIYMAFQIGIAYLFMVEPSWDFGQLYRIAIEFAKSSHPIFGSAYLYVCDNNIMTSVFLDIIYKIAYTLGLRSNWIELGIFVNIAMIDVSLFYTYQLIKCINPKNSKAYMILCLFFSPILFYIPIFYTDTLTLPFIIIPLYYFYKYFFLKQKISYIMISGLMIGIGAMMKPTTLILLMAVIIFTFLQNTKQINQLLFVPLVIGMSILPLLGQRAFISHFFDQDSLSLYRMPTIHFIGIGLEKNGEYSEERFQEINELVGEEEKIKLVQKRMRTRILEMIDQKEIGSFYNRKIAYTWTDGTFFGYEKLRREPKNPNVTKWVASSGNEDILYWSISNAEWILLLGFMVCGIYYRKNLSKEQQEFSLLCFIATFGIFLFLLIWETRSRYLINFIPLFMVNAYIGLCAYQNHRKTKQDRRIK